MKNNEPKNAMYEEYKKGLLEIFSFESKEKVAIKEIEANENLTALEKEDQKKKYAETQKLITTKRKFFEKCVNESALEEFSLIIEVLQEIYVERRDLKSFVKKMLVSAPFRKRMTSFRTVDFGEVYELVEFVNAKFPVGNDPLFTLNPIGPIYGTEEEKSSKSEPSIYLSPLSNKEIMKCLEVFLEKNPKALYTWIMEILAFDEELIVSSFKDKFIPERQNLLLEIIDLVKNDKRYQTIVSDRMFEKGDFARLVNLQRKCEHAERKVVALEENIKTLENSIKEKDDAFRARTDEQKAIIEGKNLTIEGLQEKVKKFEELSEMLNSYMVKYDAQVSINERITIENNNRIREAQNYTNSVDAENTKLQTELSEVKALYENVKSDLSLKIAEIKRLSDDKVMIECKAKEGLLQELVSALKEQLYYIILYHLELKENGTLGCDSIGMFGDTILNIKEALYSVGIEMFGILDEVIPYDSSVHDSMGVKLSNGEKVVLRVPGWKINGTIYAKAQVEKEI